MVKKHIHTNNLPLLSLFSGTVSSCLALSHATPHNSRIFIIHASHFFLFCELHLSFRSLFNFSYKKKYCRFISLINDCLWSFLVFFFHSVIIPNSIVNEWSPMKCIVEGRSEMSISNVVLMTVTACLLLNH